MSRQLVTLRDWARKMADGGDVRVPYTVHEMNAIHLKARWAHPDRPPPGVNKTRWHKALATERDLWRQIADEIDVFLADEPVVIDGQMELGGRT